MHTDMKAMFDENGEKVLSNPMEVDLLSIFMAYAFDFH